MHDLLKEGKFSTNKQTKQNKMQRNLSHYTSTILMSVGKYYSLSAHIHKRNDTGNKASNHQGSLEVWCQCVAQWLERLPRKLIDLVLIPWPR